AGGGDHWPGAGERRRERTRERNSRRLSQRKIVARGRRLGLARLLHSVEETQRAAPGDRRAFRMETRALVAMKAVRGGIQVNLAVGPLGANRFPVRDGDALAFRAEMLLGRAPRFLVGGFRDLPAVEAHRAIEPV